MIRGINALEEFLRTYVAGVFGILVDHVEAAERMGAKLVEGTDGREYVVIEGRAYPVLCGDIVPVQTEDWGPESGRCGQIARFDGSCEFHGAERAWWGSLTEREKAAVERAEDERLGV